MCTSGLLDNTNGVFAPFRDRELFVKFYAGMWIGNIVGRCDSTGDELEDHEERLERFTLLCTTETE